MLAMYMLWSACMLDREHRTLHNRNIATSHTMPFENICWTSFWSFETTKKRLYTQSPREASSFSSIMTRNDEFVCCTDKTQLAHTRGIMFFNYCSHILDSRARISNCIYTAWKACKRCARTHCAHLQRVRCRGMLGDVEKHLYNTYRTNKTFVYTYIHTASERDSPRCRARRAQSMCRREELSQRRRDHAIRLYRICK